MMSLFEHSAVLGTLGLSFVAAWAAYVSLRLLTKQRRVKTPPGPFGWPIVGNIFDLPKGDADWVDYRNMCDKCGLFARFHDLISFIELFLIDSDIVYLNVLGQPMVILNTLEVITELLEKRSAIYSSR